jgi:hypothetical protein
MVYDSNRLLAQDWRAQAAMKNVGQALVPALEGDDERMRAP